MELQPGDETVEPFSFRTDRKVNNSAVCYLTYTSEKTHEIIRANLSRSPIYDGTISGVGPRYCPSIETKIVRFPEKQRHQLFIEPCGLNTEEMYIQGFSSSMPEDVQLAMLHSVPGLEHAEMMRPAYAIEYECVDTSYIGTLIDDLVTKGTQEPYRIMTSRSEYRLLHRQDNADQRLTAIGAKVGLVPQSRLEEVNAKYEAVRREINRLESSGVPGSDALNEMLAARDTAPVTNSARLADLLRRPQVSYADLAPFDAERPPLPAAVTEEVEIQVKYAGYLARQEKQVAEFRKEEARLLPPDMDYTSIQGLRLEARQKLQDIRPVSLGQAGRISGVSPADIAVLMIYLENN